ncbi:Skp1-like protein [Fragilariopsis cylindrus CCMP1102]|uniref:Skp1-like protein n=1 Tax=Fragilariopsis cylindrus CCMP1102 TaxID=635003 RepID=A0A1E7EVM1_9STRA|nr:Skp1-like protein [Fragilariopsis cylindrus CCMP1102]|eukprot:OEU09899.1 Skp1-like protein [Fragilariopsis cylindrus CCMP1102]
MDVEDSKETAASTADTSSSGVTIQLISKEGDKFPVPITVSNMSELVKSMMDDKDDDDDDDDDEDDDGKEKITEIPLPNVKSEVLKKVIEFCEHHLAEPMTEIEKPLKSQNMADVVQKWYADFVDLEQVLLFELILAANYMDIKPLLDLTCATVASMIKGKTPDEIRATFNITNDFSPEEEAQVREENKWCEEA